MDRRSFLKGSGFAAAAWATGHSEDYEAGPRTPSSSFTFAFFTDVHLEPELRAPKGMGMAVDLINRSAAEFAICGGDHIFDGLDANRDRVQEQYDLYANLERQLRLPVMHVLGNHDVAGLLASSGMSESEAIYGKALFEKMFRTPTYYAFQYKGAQFIVLDSIYIEGRNWRPHIDAAQIAWLKRILESAPGMPTIVMSHVPLATSISSYWPGSDNPMYAPVSNSEEVIPLLERHNVLAVLQGHTHIDEVVRRGGIQYITGGAVCGRWWQGPHFGDREGVTFVTVGGGKLTTNYVPTGFVAMES